MNSLRTEAEIIASWNGNIDKPLVSVCCSTFNHRGYIEDALKAFLMQETTFPFEVIIRDDASTDGTSEIVQEYANKYPSIVSLKVNNENRFALGERAMHVWPSLIKGKYIALCEGDDFWVASDKLQKQVELLEKYQDAVMCVALTDRYQDDGNSLKHLCSPAGLDKTLLDVDDVYKTYFHTSSYMIRSGIFKSVIENYFTGHALFGDTALRAILISHGPFVLLNEVVSIYRITGKGIWTSLEKVKQLEWEYNVAKKLSGVLSGKHSKLQRARLRRASYKLTKIYIKKMELGNALPWSRRFLWHGVFRL